MKTTLNNFLNEQGRIKLPKLIDFVKMVEIKGGVGSYFHMCADYIKLIDQKPELWMFVPCGKDGKPLNEPMYDPANEQYWAAANFEYQQACDRVLFENCELYMTYLAGGMELFIGDYTFMFDDSGQLFDFEDNEYNSINDLLNADVELYVKPEKL